MHLRVHLLLAGGIAVLLAGCGRPEGSADLDPEPTVLQTTSAAPVSITVPTSTTAVTTTTAPPAPVTSTSRAPEPTTTIATETSAPVSGADDLPTVDELRERATVFIDERDAQVKSSLALEGDPDVLAGMEVEAGIVDSMTITYFEDIVVWDYSAGLREVSVGGQLLYLAEDGSWLESEDFEWPVFGALGEWAFAQSIANPCLELDPVIVEPASVVGVPTLHVRCEVESSRLDSWFDANGLVMKLVLVETYDDPVFQVETSWEVVGLDVAPGEPLPPGA